jgi:hypothetical protein
VPRADNPTTSCDDCIESWEPEPPGTLRTCPGLYRDCFTFFTFTFYLRLPPFMFVNSFDVVVVSLLNCSFIIRNSFVVSSA